MSPAPPAMAAAVERRIAELEDLIEADEQSMAAVLEEIALAQRKLTIVEARRDGWARERAEFIKVRDAAPVETPAETPKPRQKPGAVSAAVLAYVTANPGQSVDAIAGELASLPDALGSVFKPPSVRAALRDHVRFVRIHERDGGYHEGPPADEAVALAAATPLNSQLLRSVILGEIQRSPDGSKGAYAIHRATGKPLHAINEELAAMVASGIVTSEGDPAMFRLAVTTKAAE